MTPIRVRATAEADGELHLLLTVLQHDPGWVWLHDPAEDVYTEADVR